jgi:hypothetical protein
MLSSYHNELAWEVVGVPSLQVDSRARVSSELKNRCFLQLRKRAPSLAFMAEVMMNLKTVQSAKKAPFYLILMGFVRFGFHHMKKWPQSRLFVFASER